MNLRHFRFVSIALIIALICSLFPQPLALHRAMAAPAPAHPPTHSSVPAHARERIGEIETKRERNKKYYLNSDETITVEVYGSSIHYKSNGRWADIDNTIVEDESAPELPLRNKANDFTVRFARNFSGNSPLVAVRKGKYTLSITPLDAAKTTSLAGQTPATVVYKDIYPNVDLEYTADSDWLKENIILSTYTSQNTFSFELQTSQLNPILENGQVKLQDSSGSEIFSFPTPFMYDSAQAESWDIEVTLKETREQRYILTYTADAKWLFAPERVYPVTIDPTVTLPEKDIPIEDTFVNQAYPSRCYSYWEYLKSGISSGEVRRALIKFPNLIDNLKLTAADEIVSSILVLYQSYDLEIDGGYSQPVLTDVYQVLKEWNLNTVTWSNHPNNDGGLENGYRERVYDYELIFNENFRYFDITSIVKNWQDGEPNNGFILKNHNDQGPIFDFNSRRHPDKNTRPRLVITYRNQSGLEGYLSYTSAGLGRSGEAHVNNYNGNLIYTLNDVSLPGNKLPLNISHIYNSGSKDINIGYGNGWQLNFSQSVREETLIRAGVNGEDIKYAVYTDGDGTIHWFKYNEKENKYLSPAGLYLTLEKDTADQNTLFVISDNEDNKLKFDTQGRLYQIENNQGDITEITIENGTITSVKDGSGREASLGYTNAKLSIITDPSGRTTQYGYDANGNLIEIVYPDHSAENPRKTGLAFSDTNQITQVTHPAQQKLVFTCLANGKVSNLTYLGSDGTTGQSLTFAYDRNTSAVTDMAGRVTRYNFNNEGNPVNIIDHLDNAVHLRWENNNLIRQMAPKNTTVNYLWNHRFDLDVEWQLVHEASSQAAGSYVAAEVHPNAQSYRIVKTNTLGQSFIKQDTVLAPGDYTFSADVKTSAITAGNGGAHIFIRDSDGNLLAKSAYATGNQDWQRLYLNFHLEAADIISVGLGVEGAEGTAWFDSVQLEDGLAATSYNLVENSVFARENSANPSLPWRWYMDVIENLEAGDGLASSTVKFGAKSFKFEGNAQIYKNLVQTINLAGKAGDPYIISGWAKARAVPKVDEDDEFREYRTAALAIGFLNTHSGKYSWRYLDINEDYEGWQFLSGIIEAPYDYDQIYIYLNYHNNANEIYFDGIQLFNETVTSYTYDEFGNIVSVNDPNNNSSNFIFDGNKNMVGMVDPLGGSYNYAYNNKHNVLSAVSPTGVGFGFSYDDHGNLVSASHGQLNNGNLLQNGNLQAGLRSWQQEQADNTGFLFTENDPASASNPVLGLFTNPVNIDSQLLGAWQEVNVKPKTTYSLSSKVYTQFQDGSVWLEVEELDGDGNVLDTSTDKFAALPRLSWTPRFLTFTTGSNTAKVRVHLRTGKGDTRADAPTLPADPVSYYETKEIQPLKDAGASSGSPSTKYGASNWVGAGQTVSNQYRSAMGFDLPEDVMGKKIVEARLYLYDRYVSWSIDSKSAMEIWDAISGWSEGDLTWDIFPAANNPACLSWTVPGQTAVSDGTERILDLTDIVQRWADDYNSDVNGIIMEPASYTSGTYKSFYSKEHTDPA